MSRFIDSDTGPFAIVPEWLLFAPIPDRAKLVYAALARYADDGTGVAYPSRATLAERLGWSEDTVDRGIRELVKLSALEVTLRIKNRDGEIQEGKPRKGLNGWEATSSLYRIRRVRLPEVAPETGRPRVEADTPPRASGPIQNHLNETTRTRPSRATPAPGSFQAWYDSYPRRIGKQAALTAYRRACKLTSEEELLLALKRQLPDLISRDPKYIPHPATWLNQQRWADEPPRKKHWSDEIAESLA